MGKVRDFFGLTLSRMPEETTAGDVEGLLSPAMQSATSEFFASLVGVTYSPRLTERVWAASRCVQLNSQQIAAMPLRFFGSESATEPAWVSNPDPVWYPNGIGDAVHAITASVYVHGDAFLYITGTYASGFPSSWTVLDPTNIRVDVSRGRRTYRQSETPLDASRIVHIIRNPDASAVRGTSALASHASYMYGLLAASDLERQVMNSGGVPNTVLKSQKRLNAAQAEDAQTFWMGRAAARGGAPAVLGPDWDFETLQFSPADLLLLDAQSFDVRAIAAAFSVPPFMLNMPLEGGLTYQSPEMLFEVWWRSELRTMAMRISRALSAQMLPRGSWVQFDARDVLAPSFKELVESWLAMVAAGVVTIDELRAAILHLPPAVQGEALEVLTTPPSAGASPSQPTPSVVELQLRPTQVVNQ